MVKISIPKIIIMGGLAWAMWLTFWCPCEHILSCHRIEFYSAMALVLGAFVADNFIISKL